ncbi:putative GGDEF domain containing protein [Magnetofaba australis IT-1]|uniref:Putative GGDEF domain containing protein n=1 Tax=Magnetofaba australis IT-1 TaxID=1434232 RepID=A0A1Y2K5W0_9PROT|nr:putative GGDEF domain containing protein [Magnetofaba australis IT-1]
MYIWLLLTASGIAGGLVIQFLFDEQVISARGTLFLHIAESMVNQLDRDMAARLNEITMHAGDERLTRDLLSPEQRRELLTRWRDNSAFAWIGLLDRNGKIAIASDGLLEGADVSKRDYFLAGLRGEAYAGDVHEAHLLAQHMAPPRHDSLPLRFVDVAHPILDEEGAFAGVLVAHISWDWAGDVRNGLLQPLGNARGLEVILFSSEGKPLIGPDSVMASSQQEIFPRGGKERAEGDGYQLTHDENGQEYLAGFAFSKGVMGFPGMCWFSGNMTTV